MKTILKSKYRPALYQLGRPKARKPRSRPATVYRKMRFMGPIGGNLQKIALFDGRPPAQVTKAWGIMPLWQKAWFVSPQAKFLGCFHVVRESIPSLFPLFLQ
jgi:hypothetical protein